MKLTNKNGAFFYRSPGNRLFIEVDEKPVELKLTLKQFQEYQDFLDAQVEANSKAEEKIKEATNGAEVSKIALEKRIESSLDVLTIAMNPKVEAQYTRDQVEEIFGEEIDMMHIVAQTWVDKKIRNPELDQILDPLLAPQSRMARGA